jgi:hypothetical protein
MQKSHFFVSGKQNVFRNSFKVGVMQTNCICLVVARASRPFDWLAELRLKYTGKMPVPLRGNGRAATFHRNVAKTAHACFQIAHGARVCDPQQRRLSRNSQVTGCVMHLNALLTGLNTSVTDFLTHDFQRLTDFNGL